MSWAVANFVHAGSCFSDFSALVALDSLVFLFVAVGYITPGSFVDVGLYVVFFAILLV